MSTPPERTKLKPAAKRQSRRARAKRWFNDQPITVRGNILNGLIVGSMTVGVALFIWVAGLIPDALSRFTTDSTSIVEDIATTSAPPRTGPSHRATWSHLSVSQLMALAVCLPAEWVLQLAQHHSVWMWFLYSVLSTSNITSIGVAIVSTAWPEPSASSSSDRSLSISLLR